MNLISEKKLLLFLLVIETSLLLYMALDRREPLLESRFPVEPGKNYSFLIDDERFPIHIREGQSIVVAIHSDKTADSIAPDRVKVIQTSSQTFRGKVTHSRFRFTYDSPQDLSLFFSQAKLGELRKQTDWQTVEAVMDWAYHQVKVSGSPQIYELQDALELLPKLKSGEEKGFCAHYCYLTVQALQSLGFFARYLTINGHEVCEVWVPSEKKWVCLDPLNNLFYVDSQGKKMSALEISRNPEGLRYQSNVFKGSVSDLVKGYQKIWIWLTNDLIRNPVNIYDLNKYRCRIVVREDDLRDLSLGDLYTLYPDELYEAPRY